MRWMGTSEAARSGFGGSVGGGAARLLIDVGFGGWVNARCMLVHGGLGDIERGLRGGYLRGLGGLIHRMQRGVGCVWVG